MKLEIIKSLCKNVQRCMCSEYTKAYPKVPRLAARTENGNVNSATL